MYTPRYHSHGTNADDKLTELGPRAIAKLERSSRYVRGARSLRINYFDDSDQGERLVACEDLDHAEDEDEDNSITGAIICSADALLDPKSQPQTVVAISSVEAEYVAPSKVCTMILLLTRLLNTVSLEDNKDLQPCYYDKACSEK